MMKRRLPKHGDEETRTKFAWFPTKVFSEHDDRWYLIWLTKYKKDIHYTQARSSKTLISMHFNLMLDDESCSESSVDQSNTTADGDIVGRDKITTK